MELMCMDCGEKLDSKPETLRAHEKKCATTAQFEILKWVKKKVKSIKEIEKLIHKHGQAIRMTNEKNVVEILTKE